jgi:hypothetical protein
MHDSVSSAKNQVPSEIRKNDVNLQAQVKPLPIYGLASDLTPTLRNHCCLSGRVWIPEVWGKRVQVQTRIFAPA